MKEWSRSVEWLRLADFFLGVALGAALIASLYGTSKANNKLEQNLRGNAQSGVTEEAKH